MYICMYVGEEGDGYYIAAMSSSIDIIKICVYVCNFCCIFLFCFFHGYVNLNLLNKNIFMYVLLLLSLLSYR